ncbi:LIM domain containing protein [Trichuris trichiura]|uniref:LIM domain containing protein n=1 Tax=Trichuris trichiura TaxID=36087 RepID=A0A077ZBC9_TRITR|nr:LIM domain containing protein [Trichuris trichiura]
MTEVPLTCVACGNVTLCPEFVYDTLGRVYHPEHFTCSVCGKNIAAGFDYFIGNNNSILCDICYTLKLAPKCFTCKQPLGEWIVEAAGKQFHEKCFSCYACKKLLRTSKILVYNGNVYCHEDYWTLRRGSPFRKLWCYLWK